MTADGVFPIRRLLAVPSPQTGPHSTTAEVVWRLRRSIWPAALRSASPKGHQVQLIAQSRVLVIASGATSLLAIWHIPPWQVRRAISAGSVIASRQDQWTSF